MRTLLILPFLLVFASPGQDASITGEDTSLIVLNSKWSKSRQVLEKLDPVGTTGPAPAMIPQNKNFERNRRNNAPTGERDPNLDTIDGRSAALEKSVQESRSPKDKVLDGFEYKIKVQNSGKKVVEIVFFEYQFKESANQGASARRQFLCAVNIKPGKDRELQAFSLSGPSDVVSVEGLANKSGSHFEEKVVINRVEYADGSIWQRKGWNFGEIRQTYKRAVETPWGAEMCRGL